VLGKTWASLDLACACSEDDATRLVVLGVPASHVHVTGDPGVDAAADRVARADPTSRTLAPFHAEARPTIVAGSTWPDDEAALLPALDVVRRSVKEVRVIVAPHEPSPDVVRELSARLSARGWRVSTLAEVEARGSAEGVDAVLVERVGVLAGLYTVADVAYVGGGFGTRGLHSVVEPAAARVPVAVGPRHARSAACVSLVGSGGARAAADAAALGENLRTWLLDPGLRKRASEQVFVYIEEHRGSARRTADLLDPLFTVRSKA
jgi:3-deoxy-D-manno-octulosonic-acid transferase